MSDYGRRRGIALAVSLIVGLVGVYLFIGLPLMLR